MISFLVISFFGKKLPRGGDWIGVPLLFINLALSLILFAAFTMYGKYSYTIDWIDFGTPSISKFTAGFTIDEVTAIMLIVVNTISSLVHLFSVKYMEGDAKYSRYYAHLGLFTFSMIGLVLTNNILLMYVFWELVGISSYLLIGFWYENKAPQEAAKKHSLLTGSEM
jgi:NADH-quinone oxidoreductase subunit L